MKWSLHFYCCRRHIHRRLRLRIFVMLFPVL